ncbi:hypothetical protein WJX73_000935 [Symbiochloris irregularis]|uniref:J domain-containing protein n=1 Tax=Symbiochloris irregularis TaxID=706552 RepID=A0AAW1NW48_9CHLO
MQSTFIICNGPLNLNSATKRGLQLSCRARPARFCTKAVSCSSISSSKVTEAFQQLGLSGYGSKDDVRTAYLAKMKQLHPDLNPGGGTTELAARVTVAYHDLMQGFLDGTIGDLSDIDVFDSPEGEPDHIFINPFACNISPMEWRELQHIATTAVNDIEAALSRHGVYMQSTAVSWLTAAQLQSITADLTAMEDSLSFEFTSWLISDCLLRAGRANNMMPMAG